MRVLALLCLVALAGCTGTERIEGFTATGPASFLYSARTNAALTENDSGEAERIRRGWLAGALKAHDMCGKGYVIDSRRFVQDIYGRFGNGGDILYRGRCL
jgi:hypothetical protein